MKKFIISLGIASLFVTSSQAFDSGTYRCQRGMELIEFTLKPNGRAKMYIMTSGESERGYWQDDDDAAIVIRENIIIEKTNYGSGYKLANGGIIDTCEKIY